MLGATVLFSLVAPAIAASGGSASPFLFNAAWRLTNSVNIVPFLLARYHRVLQHPRAARAVLHHCRHWTILAALPATTVYACAASLLPHLTTSGRGPQNPLQRRGRRSPSWPPRKRRTQRPRPAEPARPGRNPHLGRTPDQLGQHPCPAASPPDPHT